MINKGHCSNCGAVIYVEERYRPALKDAPSRWFTEMVLTWPPPGIQTERLVAYMATETGPDICHCYHCGRRIKGADQC